MIYVDGRWISSSGTSTTMVINPFDQSVIATLTDASGDDVARAIAAARRAFDAGDWSTAPVTERGALLHRVADLLERDKDAGRPRRVARHRQAPRREPSTTSTTSSRVFRHYGRLAGRGRRPRRRHRHAPTCQPDRARAGRRLRR